jgi:hypothetical protein
VLGHRGGAEQDVAQARAQEKNHIFGRGLVQDRLQRKHRVELGFLDQAELDQQRAELAVVLHLPRQGGVEPRARQESRAGQKLSQAVIGRCFGSFRQAPR